MTATESRKQASKLTVVEPPKIINAKRISTCLSSSGKLLVGAKPGPTVIRVKESKRRLPASKGQGRLGSLTKGKKETSSKLEDKAVYGPLTSVSNALTKTSSQMPS